MSDRPFSGVFVTGTDTNVGKTVVAAALVARLRPHQTVRYWKPIQTGIEQDDDTATVQRLSGCTPGEVYHAGIRLPRPLSPHLAAHLAGAVINLDDLLTLALAQPAGECWVVEGAGGVFVPLNDSQMMIDLISVLGAPVVVTARSGLGTINHTLLTLQALRARALSVAGVVMVGERNAENRAAIERYGDVAVLGELPTLAPISAATLRAASVDWDLTWLGLTRSPAGSPERATP